MNENIDIALLKDMIREETEEDTMNLVEDYRMIPMDYLFDKDEFLD